MEKKFFTAKFRKGRYPIRYYFTFGGHSHATFCAQYKRLRGAGISREDAREILLITAVLFAEEKLD